MSNEQDKDWPRVGDVVAYRWRDDWGRSGPPERWTVFRRTPTVVEMHRGSRPEVKSIRGLRQIQRLLEPWEERHEIAIMRERRKRQIEQDCEQIKALAFGVAHNRLAHNDTLSAMADAVREALALVKKAAGGTT